MPDWYYVCLINSQFISLYVDSFINNTSHFQINDARQLPIIIPTATELEEFSKLFKAAESLKIKQFSSEITVKESIDGLKIIQSNLDNLVNELYGV